LRQIDERRRHEVLFQEAEAAWAKKDPASLALARLRAILVAYPKHERALALQRRDRREAPPRAPGSRC
jgi:hypothetical protein